MTETAFREVQDAKIYAESIINTIREALIVLDEHLRVVSANNSFYRSFMSAEADTIGHHIYRLGNGQWDIPRLRELLKAVITQDAQFKDFEVEHTFPSIGHRIMLLNARKIKRPVGQGELILLVLEDVTGEREKYRLAGEAYTLLENTLDLAVRFDVNKKYVFANRAAAELVRRPKEQIIGKTLGELGSPPRTAELLNRAFENVLRTKQSRKFEAQYGDRHFETMMAPELDEKGNVVSFMMFGRENTEEKKAEDVLRKERELLQAIIKFIPVMITIYDPHTLEFKANKELERVSGWTNEDFRRLNPMEAVYPDPEYRTMMTEYMRSLTPGFKDIVMTAKDGSKIETSWANVRLPDGRQVGIGLDMRERKKAEQALRESREDLNRAQALGHIGSWRLDIQRNELTWSDEAYRIFGIPPETALTYDVFLSYVHPEDREYVDRQWKAALKGGQYDIEHRIIVEGDVTWVREKAEIEFDRDGRISGGFGTVQDITDRKRSEEALRQSESRYRELFNSLDEGFCVIEVLFDEYNEPVDYRFLEVNASFERQTGLHESMGKRMRELVPDHERHWFETYGRIVLTGKPERFENEAKGLHRWYDVYAFRVGEKESRKVAILFNDITRRKQAEDDLRRNEYELRTLVDNSPDLIFRLSRQLQYVYVNPAYERLTGMPKEQFIGKTNDELGMPQQSAMFWQSAVQDVLELGRERSAEFALAGLFGKRYFAARIIPEFEKSGLVETVLVIARDITERKQSEEQVRYVSFHDRVTGLFNRAFFEEEIRRIDTERGLPISIIVGDVNNLKLVNDVFGHGEGDRLLRATAESIRKACRGSDIVARWGGDEFAVILPKTDFVTADGVCARIGEIAREYKGTVLQPSVAAGIATKEHRDQSIYQVIRQAEQHMYDYKLDHAEENKAAMLSVLLRFAGEKTSDYSAHIDRSYELACRFGDELGMSEEQQRDLRMLVELHDIGEAVVPGEVLAKPGKLNDDERAAMKKHVEAGFRIVKTFAGTSRIADEVLSHAEHWNGAGYPRGLKGRNIPYLARVFAIIDAFDAMTHPRPYARTFTREEAAEELRRYAGRQFDPGLVDVFIGRVLREDAGAPGT